LTLGGGLGPGSGSKGPRPSRPHDAGETPAFQVSPVWRPYAFQNCCEARRAPSAIAASFAQTTSGSTAACPTQVPKPQSLPAMTLSRPTRFAYRAIRCATNSGCSIKFDFDSMTPGMIVFPSGNFARSNKLHSCAWRGLAASKEIVLGRAKDDIDDVGERHV